MKKFIKLPYLPILIAPFLLFSPLILTGKALFWGTPSLQFVPWWDWAWETLRGGHLPLWNPLVGMGAPLVANYQSALFYPPNWIYFLLHGIGGTPLMAWGQGILVVFHLIMAGLGMIFLIKLLGGDELSQTVSGLSFCLSGYLVARAGFLSINAVCAWLPWLMAFSLKMVRKRSIKSAGKLAIVMTLQILAGHAQITYYSLLLTIPWVIFWSWVNEKESSWQAKSKYILRNLGLFLIIGLISFSIAAVQVLPTAEYLAQSHRAKSVDYEYAMTYSFWPWHILNLFVPDLFGNPKLGNYWGYANYWEDALYIGLLPLILALGILIKSIRNVLSPPKTGSDKHDRAFKPFTIFLGLISFISFLLALGKNTPVFPWLYENIPTFDLFQAPTRINIWAVFALSSLAGIGVECWRKPRKRRLYWARLATAGAGAVTMGAIITHFLLGDVKPTFIRATAIAGFWGVGVGLLTLKVPSSPQSRKENKGWQWAVTIWVAADLLVAGWGLNPGVGMDFYGELETSPDKVERLYLPASEEYHIKYEKFFKFEAYEPDLNWSVLREASLPNLNMLDGLASVNNFDPLVPGRYQNWMEALEDTGRENRERVLKLMGVGSVGRIGDRGEVVYEVIPGGQSYYRWVSCGRVVKESTKALSLSMTGDVNLQKWVLIDQPPSQKIGPCEMSEGEIELVEKTPNRWSFKVSGNQAGWLLRSSVWYPGWNAYIDGKKTTLHRGNYLFQAVHVPAGNHEVVFIYRPKSLMIGGTLSVLSIFSCLLIWRVDVHSRKKKKDGKYVPLCEKNPKT